MFFTQQQSSIEIEIGTFFSRASMVAAYDNKRFAKKVLFYNVGRK